ncbi:MAG: squalene--hopene cyclase [Planctomycetes bacterium]|nr:squalene--hopene cyclase [Planctomycetota bacterium]
MRQNAQSSLLAARNPKGHWEGELSSSALSTATAVIALEAFVRSRGELGQDRREAITQLIEAGRQWLKTFQNKDGGWGDTIQSLSNISTTLLCWGALHQTVIEFDQTNFRATKWIENYAVGTTPEVLAPAIRHRYGKDQTFSVPILTALALTGRLGESSKAWKLVPQLPFELAACPKSWFAAMRLPVVSYALPALIAIGLVKHRKQPSWSPISRTIRDIVTKRTLNVLQSIQPTTGGFLEATPLTSFVAMSLIGAGEGNHPVVENGIQFLIQSARDDGSWPIDTHLATWVSTLAINALSHSDEFEALLGKSGIDALKPWLIEQQYTTRHPYTDAASGGWAWTPLSGGVPDADDTPGAVLALDALHQRSAKDDLSIAKRAEAGIEWLIGLQNRDGGIPTFCRGWGTLPFDRSSPDITAHAIRAMISWQNRLPTSNQSKIERAIRAALQFLSKRQEPEGAWTPLWFGNQFAPDESNRTYGTTRVLLALLCTIGHDAELPRNQFTAGLTWVLRSQNPDGGWGGEYDVPSSIEETALAIESLTACISKHASISGSKLLSDSDHDATLSAIRSGLQWLFDATQAGTAFPASPIGFYFAKLWYFEKLYPLVYTVAALNRAHSISTALFPEHSNRN